MSAQQIINQVAPGDGLGDSIYVAFGKCNTNFTALFAAGGSVVYSSGNTLTSGNNNNLVLPGTNNYIFDVSAAAGNAVVTGIVAQADGQKVTFVRTDSTSNTLEFASLSSSSSSANRLRIIAAGLALPAQYTSITFQYSQSLGYWTMV